MGDFWNYGWLLNYEWLLNYGWVGGQAHRHTDRHTHRHINTMTRPGQRAGPSEKFTHNSKVHRQFKSSPIIQKFMCKAKLWVRGQARRHTDKHTHTHTDRQINTRPCERSRIRSTAGPLVCVWFRSTDSIPWV